MRNFLLACALVLAAQGVVFADGMNQVVSSTTVNPEWQVVVFNDSGSSIVSGEIVTWDVGDTEWERSGYPYVTTTTTTDSPAVAGVVASGLDCPDQSLCSIVVYGPTIAKIADATDAVGDATLVSTSSVDGQVGDYTAAANTCALGMLMELRDVDSALDLNRNGSRMWVFVDPDCQ